jgi:hypothetical protein
MITFVLLINIFLIGGIVTAVELRTAPEAYQNKDGFHLVWTNNAPEKCDVAAIWSRSAFCDTLASKTTL